MSCGMYIGALSHCDLCGVYHTPLWLGDLVRGWTHAVHTQHIFLRYAVQCPCGGPCGWTYLVCVCGWTRAVQTQHISFPAARQSVQSVQYGDPVVVDHATT